GPATLRVRPRGAVVTARTWGPGAGWLLDRVPDWLGFRDDRSGFTAHHPVVGELVLRCPGLRVGRTSRVFEALVPAVLEQKVVGREAHRAWRFLLLKYGEAAPVGDYHLPNVVGWTLARRKTDDAGMLELLAPYAGHRYRVTRLIELGGSGPPRRGPRMSVRDYRSF